MNSLLPVIAMLLTDLASLPPLSSAPAERGDWLVRPPAAKAALYRSDDNKELILDNGLVRRTFRLAPNAATVGLENRRTGETLLRAVEPEAQLTIDGRQIQVGGLSGQPNRAFLRREWLDTLTAAPDSLPFAGFALGRTAPRFAWKPTGGVEAPWPPPGVALTLRFESPAVRAEIRYELYDGLPLLSKQVILTNTGARAFRLNRFVVETLAAVEAESIVDVPERWEQPNLTVVTDYSFGGMAQNNARSPVRWRIDPAYETQVNYEKKTPCLLECAPPVGPEIDVAPGESAETFRVFELLHDSADRERRGLAIRRMYRALAPWSQDNPLMLHLTSTDPATMRTAIDQCAEVGFEMVILSFGSGLNMEDISVPNLAKFKEIADYAHRKGLRFGGYSLLASRRISEEHDVIHPQTGKTGGAIFGNSPCLCSAWGREYFDRIRRFFAATGFDLLEHDGSYPGDVCASTTHPDHRDLGDSQWKQFERIAAFYRECRAQGIFLNVPDWYFLQGSAKTGMGYRETNWSLPRAQQHIHCRQNLFDGTWEKTPSMGWMMTPLVEYQGGGAAATIEPLKEHLSDYGLHLANNLGYGAQACYRGPRLFDAPQTKAMVKGWVDWFKAHRAILESDLLHLRRADGRDWDGVLHVNPARKEKGLAVLYNPLFEPITREIVLPLYYTGLTERARVRIDGKGRAKVYRLARDYSIRVTVTIPPQGLTWLTLE